MAEEKIPGQAPEEQNAETKDLLAQIEDMKKNYVKKEDYEKVVDERQQLFEKVINGDPIPEQQEEKLDVKELRDKLFGGDGTNCKNDLEFTENALKLRKALIESGEPDPFLPIGHELSPTDADIAAAERAAETMARWVEEAKGNKDVYLTERIRDIV